MRGEFYEVKFDGFLRGRKNNFTAAKRMRGFGMMRREQNGREKIFETKNQFSYVRKLIVTFFESAVVSG